jgi:hypothetical protein
MARPKPGQPPPQPAGPTPDPGPGDLTPIATHVMCTACCWGERCDNPGHYYRPECPVCRGAGWLPKGDQPR